MWNDILLSNAEDLIRSYDLALFRFWMKRITTKLFETQSALSRLRFKLVKRISNPMYERSSGIPALVKRRLLDQHSEHIAFSIFHKKKKEV